MKTNSHIMTQAEIIDCGLDCEADSLAYVLARLLESALKEIKDIAECETCSDIQAEANLFQRYVDDLLDCLQNGDLAEINEMLGNHCRGKRQEPIE